MKKICIIGFFNNNKSNTDGQSIKTLLIYDHLRKNLNPSDKLYRIDTTKNKLLFLKIFNVFFHYFFCDHILILPSYNGIQFFCKLLNTIFFLKKQNIYYIVIGGWLANLINLKPKMIGTLKKFKYIIVETDVIKSQLEFHGLNNIIKIPNFKNVEIMKIDDLKFSNSKPHKLCTLSRVMKEKGIEDIIEAICIVNTLYNDEIFTLDIYGKIENDYKTDFDTLLLNSPNYIKYKGIVNFNKTVDTLKNYSLLVFPTRYKTEGIPGTIIDSFSAGLPVISSKWESCEEIITNNITGMIYEFLNTKELVEILIKLSQNIELISPMKINCINESSKYTVNHNIKKIINLLGE